MNKTIDLHVHSTCSDGTFSPVQLVDYAVSKRLSAFALTDHDTIDGIAPAIEAAIGKQLQVIPGIEISTVYHGKDVHILGLGIDFSDCTFQKNLIRFRDSRNSRNHKLVDRLNEYAVNISLTQMEERFPNVVLTRAHFARFLMDEGYTSTISKAFERYIGDDAPCFVPREKASPAQAIELIHAAGGYASLAHPLLYHLSDKALDALVNDLARFGIDALEAIYSTNRWTDESNMKRLARKYKLKITGGSDFHGENKPGIDLGSGRGNLSISYDIWTDLLQ